MLDVVAGRGIVQRQMSEKNDGGPAYPQPVIHAHQMTGGTIVEFARAGMTLRDWFAGQALSAVLQSSGDLQAYYEYMAGSKGDNLIPLPSSIASYCYELADAMLKERAK